MAATDHHQRAEGSNLPTARPELVEGFKRSNVAKSDFRAGFTATMPLWLGAAPFGAIYAVSALAAGLGWAQTLAMSLFVFAGASQFTAVGLFASGAAPLAIVLTTLIINARHALLAASLAPFVRETRPETKALLAFQLTDESYAIGMRRWLEGTGSLAYQFGANLSMYVVWQCSTIAGILLGNLIPNPAAYGLDLVFPLTFIGLLVPLLRERVSLAVALLAAALAIGGALLLPGSWYLLLAGIVASGIGAWLSRGRLAVAG
ncbi:MAG TPA: AzlC family ABC transporter permease [Roseiflexaceae bacterium]|nr:AzlC family ABC transporter permease [Roseiflexaceae bacterium]